MDMVAPTGSFYDSHNLLVMATDQNTCTKTKTNKKNTYTHTQKRTRTDINAGVRSCKQEAAVNTVSKVRRDPGKRFFFVGGYFTCDVLNT